MLQRSSRRVEEMKKRANYAVIFKSGGSTMTLFDNLFSHQANHRVKALRQMWGDWQGCFLITQKHSNPSKR